MKVVRFLKRLALSVLFTFVGFAVIEGGLRVFGVSYPPLELPIVLGTSNFDLEIASQEGIYLPDPRQFWRPRPGAAVAAFSGDRDATGETINAAGYRGPLLPEARTPGTLRIATLGDSSAFGMKVAFDDCFTARLAFHLTERGVATEVLCGGVVGFTIQQGLERYRALVRRHAPDIVVGYFGALNESFSGYGRSDEQKIEDNLRPKPRMKAAGQWLRRHSRCAHVLSYLADATRGGRESILRERQKSLDELGKENNDETTFKKSWKGVRRVSPSQFVKLIIELKNAVAADGAQLVIVSPPRKPWIEIERPFVVEYTKTMPWLTYQQGIPFCDARRRFLDSGDPEKGYAWLFADDDPVHPNKVGHDLIARALADLLWDTKPVQRFRAPPPTNK